MISVIFDCVENTEHFTTLLGQLNADFAEFDGVELLVPHKDASLTESIEKSLNYFSSRMYWRLFKMTDEQKSVRPLFDEASNNKKIFIRHDCLFTPGSIRHIVSMAETHVLAPKIWRITNRFKNADKFSGFVPDIYFATYLSQDPIENEDYCFVVPAGSELSDDHYEVGGYVFASDRKISNDIFFSASKLEEVNNLTKHSVGVL